MNDTTLSPKTTPGEFTHLSHFRRHQWLMLFLVCFAYIFFTCGRQNISFAFIGFQNVWGFSKTETGFLAGTMLLFYGLGQFVNGSLSDVLSPRWMLLVGAIGSLLCNWGMANAPYFWGLMVLFAVNGYCQAFAFPPGGKIITAWWGPEERARAFSLYIFATALAGVVGTIIPLWCLKHLAQWQGVLLYPPVLMVVAACIYALYVRNHPGESGYDSTVNPWMHKASAFSTSANENWQRFVHNYRVSLRNIPFLFACVACGFANAARYGLLIWVPIHFLGADWKADPNGAWLVIALPVGMALGAIAAGDLSERLLGSKKLAVLSFIGLAAIINLIMAVNTSLPVYLGMALMFLSGFLVYGPQAPLFAYCADELDCAQAATGIGIMNAAAYGFTAISEVLMGYIIDKTGTTQVIFLVVALLSLGGFLSALGMKASQRLKPAEAV